VKAMKDVLERPVTQGTSTQLVTARLWGRTHQEGEGLLVH